MNQAHKDLDDVGHAFAVERHARERWWHEEELINQRLGWLLTAQGVIGAGYAWLMHRIAEIATEVAKAPSAEIRSALSAYRERLIELSGALWGIGVVMAAFVFVGVLAAVFAQRSLREHYRHHPFQLGISAGTTIAGQAVAVSVPLVCMLAWKVVDEKLRGTW